MNTLRSKTLPWILALSFGFTLAPSARAQDQGSTGSSKPSDPQSQSDTKDVRGYSAQKSDSEADTSAASATIPVLGGATPLTGATGPLRWGDFFVRAVSFTQLYDQVDYLGASTPTKFSRNTSLFQAGLAFDRLTRHGHFAVQYTPRLAVVDGQVYPDYSNQNVNLNLLYDLSPRWTMELRNTLTYLSTQNVFASFYVDADTQSGRTIQNNFLDGPGSLLNETAGVTFNYRWSQRTTISFAPTFSYLRTTGFQSPVLSSDDYSGSVSAAYQLSARSVLGAFFHSEDIRISGPQGSTQVYSTGLSYSRHMGESWRISGSFGATRNPASGVTSPWTFNASGSLTRAFRRSSMGVVYTRDLAQGYVTNNFADRVDGFFAWRIARPLQWRSSVGYQRESSINNPISANYTVNGFQLHLAPRVTLFADYAYRLQNGDGTRVLTGHRNFVSGGIRWDASPATETF